MDAEQRERLDHLEREAVATLETIMGRERCEGLGARALVAGYEVSMGFAPCECPECVVAVACALSLGADMLCRMDERSALAALDAVRERWDTAIPPTGVNTTNDYRTIARNLRLLYPFE